MIPLFDSIQASGSLKHSKHSDMVRSKSISTPMRYTSHKDMPYPLARRPTLRHNSDITLYTVSKSYQKNKLRLNLDKNILNVNKGDLVQLITKGKDPNYVYVKMINNIGEGLVPVTCLEEYWHLPGKISSTTTTTNDNSISNDNSDIMINKLSISSLQTINSLSHHHLMELTPPTSPSTITSTTFSLGCLSRNSRSSPRSSPTLVKKPFDKESQLISMCIDSVENKNDRLLYTLKITNQLKQETWKELYYQDLYHLHLDMISNPSYNSNELFLPKLPAPLPPNISNLPMNTIDNETVNHNNLVNSNSIDNARLERIQQINLYIQSMFKVLSMEADSHILKNIWFNSILKSIESTNDNNVIVKIKVLYDGDYHAFKCNFLEINYLMKLQDTVSMKLNHDNHSPTTVYTAVIDGWYKVNLTSEEIYKEVLIKIKESQRFTLEIYD
ncbi:hypothetical protein MOUN0_H06810 [Monosporozyma unispora]|nr:hypothetical protein C6P44_000453 [Kazachstania unispora]